MILGGLDNPQNINMEMNYLRCLNNYHIQLRVHPRSPSGKTLKEISQVNVCLMESSGFDSYRGPSSVLLYIATAEIRHKRNVYGHNPILVITGTGH